MKSTRKTTTIEQAAEVLKKANSIALFSHTRPDGDTVGASLSLLIALRKMGKTVSVFCDSPMSYGVQKFERASEYSLTFAGKFDLMVAVDCGDLLRLGEFSNIYDKFHTTMTLDHHGGEYFSDFNCVKDYASTCQIVFEIIKVLGVEIDSELATYLYMGLCTDTGNFSNSNTDRASFLMAAELCELGADMRKVYRVFFQETTFAVSKLWGHAMQNMRSYFDGKLMIIFITQQDLARYGADASASEGLVQNALAVDSAVAAVSLCEYSTESFKVSMRGNNFDVRQVCRSFGGNGHLHAAGCMINGIFEDVVEKIVRAFDIAFSEQ